MQANELRIGNWLIINGKPNIIQGGGIAAIQSGYLQNTKPIPLTPEILEKAGFEANDYLGKDIVTKKHDSNTFPVYINLKTMSYCWVDYEGTIDDVIAINSVHQLQNLYFALTGIELEINL